MRTKIALFLTCVVLGGLLSSAAHKLNQYDKYIDGRHKYIAKLEVEAKKIRSVGETQQQLIDAGYGCIWADGEIKQLKVDYIWGPNTTKAYGNWKASDWDKYYED